MTAPAIQVPDAFDSVAAELDRQQELAFGNDTPSFDEGNSKNDWVSYISAYAGRAGSAFRNEREEQDFRENMVKVAALAISAIRAHDAGHC